MQYTPELSLIYEGFKPQSFTSRRWNVNENIGFYFQVGVASIANIEYSLSNITDRIRATMLDLLSPVMQEEDEFANFNYLVYPLLL